MKTEKKANTTYTYNLTDMTDREVRLLLFAVQHEIREVNKVLRVSTRGHSTNSLATNETRKLRVEAKREEFLAMQKALFVVLGIDEEEDDDEEEGD